MKTMTFQETMDQLYLRIRTGYPVIYIVSHEESRVLDCLSRIMRVIRTEEDHDDVEPKHLLCWYDGEGIQEVEGVEPLDTPSAPDPETSRPWLDIKGVGGHPEFRPVAKNLDAAKALDSLRKDTVRKFPDVGNSLSVFFDTHQYLRSRDGEGSSDQSLVRAVRNTAAALRRYYAESRDEAISERTDDTLPARPFAYKTLVIVAATASDLSSELERDIIRIEFPLPEHEELRRELGRMIERTVLQFPSEIDSQEIAAVCRSGEGDDVESATIDDDVYRTRLKDLIAGAGRGLTLEDFRLGLNGFAVRGEGLTSRHYRDMLDLKAKAINDQALQYNPNVNVDLGGLEMIKKWVRLRREPTVYESIRRKYRLAPPKGVLLCGASGAGKSMLARLIASEFKLALLRLDVGALFGSFVGESEDRARRALQLAEMLAPVVLWIDEVEKAFSGMDDGGDSGVSARVFGTILTWMSDQNDGVFVVATANDHRKILKRFPEFGRRGRFDEIFFVRSPDDSAREEIFRIYLEKHLRDGFLPLEDGPSGTDANRFIKRLVSASTGMTGAEIEFAVNESFYELYHHGRGLNPESDRESPEETVYRTIVQAQDRAIYKPGGSMAKWLEELEGEAIGNGWPVV